MLPTNPKVNGGNTPYKDAGDQQGTGGWTKNGITYSSVVATITYVVKDDGQGALYVANRKLDPSAVPTFVNTYNAAVSGDETAATNVQFTKEFKGSEWADGETFEFKLDALTECAPMPEGRKLADGEFGFTVTNVADKSAQPTSGATGSNDADGTNAVSPLNNTPEKLNADVTRGLAMRDASGDAYTYQYKGTEDPGGNHSGVTMDQSEFSVTVKVTDTHQGALSVEVTSPDGGIVFNNQYGVGATATAAMTGVKVLDSAEGSNPPTLQDIAGKYILNMSIRSMRSGAKPKA